MARRGRRASSHGGARPSPSLPLLLLLLLPLLASLPASLGVTPAVECVSELDAWSVSREGETFGPLGLYLFDETDEESAGGGAVTDRSGDVYTPLAPLAVNDPARVQRPSPAEAGDGLRRRLRFVAKDTLAATPTVMSPWVSRIQQSDEYTVVAWVAPRNRDSPESTPSRVVTLVKASETGTSCYRRVPFMLGQDDDRFETRQFCEEMRSDSGEVGRSYGLTMLTLTMSVGSRRQRMYLDGSLERSLSYVDSFSHDFYFFPSSSLHVGNVPSLNRQFYGDMFAVAVYDRELSAAEVASIAEGRAGDLLARPELDGDTLLTVAVGGTTAGGDRLAVAGRHLGGVRVTLGSREGLLSGASGPFVCEVDAAASGDASVECVTGPGVGRGLFLRAAPTTTPLCDRPGNLEALTVAEGATFSYPAPALAADSLRLCDAGALDSCRDSVNGSGSVQADNTQPQYLLFEGSGFGAFASLLRVDFFPDADLDAAGLTRAEAAGGRVWTEDDVAGLYDGGLSASSCQVQEAYSDDSAVLCQTESGNQQDLRAVVTVGHGLGAEHTYVVAAVDVFSFAFAPTITGAFLAGAPPDGQAPACEAATGECDAGDACPALASCPTVGEYDGGEPVRVRLTGTLFDSACYVSVGGEVAPGFQVVSASELLCTLPPGTGTGVPVSVVCGSRFSRPAPLVTYARPRIERVTTGSGGGGGPYGACQTDPGGQSLQDCPPRGGATVRLLGSSFGAGGAVVLVGGEPCGDVTHSDDDPHRDLTCVLPAGSGDVTVLVVQAQGRMGDAAEDQAVISYRPCQPGSAGGRREQNFTCSACAAGEFTEQPGALVCSLCAGGRVSNATGASSCDGCAAGRFAASAGSSACQACEPGRVSGADARACGACEAGRASSPDGRECEQCQPGRYAPAEGGDSCLECEPGRVSGTGSAECVACDAGRYDNGGNGTACLRCAVGRFSDNPGATVCDECPAGQFQNEEGATECVACQSGRQYLVPPVSEGDLPRCADCPKAEDGAVDAVDCIEGEALSRTNYWLYTDPATGLVTPYRCLRRNVCEANNRCGPNRVPAEGNTLCGRCLDDYYEWDGKCVDCSGGASWWLWIMLCVVGWSLIAVFHRATQTVSGLARIFFFFVQSAWLLASADHEVVAALGFLNFNIIDSSGGIACAGAIDPLTKLWLGVSMPVVALAQLWLMAAAAWAVRRACGSKRPPPPAAAAAGVGQGKGLAPPPGVALARAGASAPSPSAASAASGASTRALMGGDDDMGDNGDEKSANDASAAAKPEPGAGKAAATVAAAAGGVPAAPRGGLVNWNAYKRTSIALTILSYNAVTAATVAFFRCIDVGDDRVVATIPSVSCRSAEYKQWLPLAYSVLLVCVIGMPVVMLVFLWWNKDKLGRSRQSSFVTRWGVLFEMYRGSVRVGFESYAIVRRTLLIAFSSLLILETRVTRFSVLALLCLVFLVVHTLVRPFRSPLENKLEYLSLTALTAVTIMLCSSKTPLAMPPFIILIVLVFVPTAAFAGFILYTRGVTMYQKRANRRGRRRDPMAGSPRSVSGHRERSRFNLFSSMRNVMSRQGSPSPRSSPVPAIDAAAAAAAASASRGPVRRRGTHGPGEVVLSPQSNGSWWQASGGTTPSDTSLASPRSGAGSVDNSDDASDAASFASAGAAADDAEARNADGGGGGGGGGGGHESDPEWPSAQV